MSLRETVATKVVEAGGRLTVRSALNPILWLCAIVTVPALIAIPFSGSLRSLLTAMAAGPVIAAIFGFLFLLFFDRDKLQSEDYQIRKRTLELIEQKGEPPIPADDARVISNPENPALPPGEEERS
jgi:hypothetical protein